MKRYLFLCSQNRLRSPTAEQIFSQRSDIEVASAATNLGAIESLTGEWVEWADVIVAMEKVHRTKLRKRYGRFLKAKRVVCLDIPDNYAFMEPALIALLEQRMARHWR